jgi:hypothetical protein
MRPLGFVLGLVVGFDLAWARLTEPDVFHRMFALESATVYLLMGSAVAVAFAGSRLLRRRPTAAQLGGGRVLAVAVAAGIAAGVALQPLLTRHFVRTRQANLVPTSPATEVL